ncbi:M48 family metallopeptidase [bacterium]|nr:M48 family metallopeptidase [bacterium]
MGTCFDGKHINRKGHAVIHYLVLIFFAYSFVAAVEYILAALNLSHLKKYGATIPPEFEGVIDQLLLTRTRDYVSDKNRLENYSSVVSHGLVLVFIFAGVLNAYNHWIAGSGLPFVVSGLCFFLILVFVKSLLHLPFAWYQTFKIEAKYGFNTMTVKLWARDFIKTQLISLALLSVLITGGLWLVRTFPHTWWLLVWVFFVVVTLFVMYLSPYVLEPLFNKFTLIDQAGLADKIKAMMQKAGLEVGRVFKMDASKRSRHTNAYFTGIGRVKRIVLYDTLIEKMAEPEIVSVLAHEVGHWKKKHVLKRLLLTEIAGLIIIYLFYLVMQSDGFLQIFLIQDDTLFSKLVLFQFLFSIIAFPFGPIFNALSRNQEREADRFAVGLTGSAEPLVNSLIKLSKDNLSNLHPHPLYAGFYYSHPPVVERIRDLRGIKTT